MFVPVSAIHCDIEDSILNYTTVEAHKLTYPSHLMMVLVYNKNQDKYCGFYFIPNKENMYDPEIVWRMGVRMPWQMASSCFIFDIPYEKYNHPIFE